jgi:hypothetical protein
MNIHSPARATKTTVLAHNATGSGQSAALDVRGFTRLMLIFIATTAGGASYNAKVQECATTGGSYADVVGAAIAAVGASQTSNDQLIELNLDKRLEFLEITSTVVGTVSYDIVAVLFNPNNAPTTQDNAVVSVM